MIKHDPCEIEVTSHSFSNTHFHIKEIASAVHKVINKSLHVNNGWLIELEEFSRRLHRMDVKLTACDFFRLDLTLLHSIISILVTYLVILLQVKDE
ncbi:Protein of unknown function [Cotesia congregata]|uniref:Gustatory receptor n=1 Tax=Cotesia congregata TaxID=51543 RepID=A0A8J2E731_COTCN|nr:Protein of unknown function [Cotesia congregata]